MPEPLERPEKIVSPALPVERFGGGSAGGAGGVSTGVVEAMIFPVCVGEGRAPLAAVHRMGDGRRHWAGGRHGCYERDLTVSRTLALISAGIGA